MTDSKKTFHKAPVLIIGLQKSGTSLINRMLGTCDSYFFPPFNLEGREFWGDDPPFSPTKPPCGVLYQNKKGIDGHCLSASDYSKTDQERLYSELNIVAWDQPIWINKNPYNSVRIAWLKNMFPECMIIAVVRKPEANVFSLMKKFIPHDNRGLGPENGWWGVKPANWEALLSDNKIIQLAQQWNAVNKAIIAQIASVDLLVDYAEVCQKPAALVARILQHYRLSAKIEMEPFPDMNHEYLEGGRLLSMNREFQQLGGQFDLSKAGDNEIEIKKMTFFEKRKVRKICSDTWKQCLKLRTRL